MNSQKVQNVTKLRARDSLSLSLQLMQPKREATEGTTKKSRKSANNENQDTLYGANNMVNAYALRPLKLMRYFLKLEKKHVAQ
tara:strand:- start:462 stop:710 length:249 start_codon:yes stop_codon:yes gene_type:complete